MENAADFPTVLGPDARFKGELTFDKGVRILGQFEGHVRSKGTLHVADGARVVAQIEAANVRIDGEVKGNVVCSEKLQLAATCRIEGDLRATRLEMNDGAQFVGHVVVGAAAAESAPRRDAQPSATRAPDAPRPRPAPTPEPVPVAMPGVGR